MISKPLKFYMVDVVNHKVVTKCSHCVHSHSVHKVFSSHSRCDLVNHQVVIITPADTPGSYDHLHPITLCSLPVGVRQQFVPRSLASQKLSRFYDLLSDHQFIWVNNNLMTDFIETNCFISIFQHKNAMVCLIFPQIVTSVAVLLRPGTSHFVCIRRRSISVQKHGVRVGQLPPTQHLEIPLPQLEVPVHVSVLLHIKILVNLAVEVHGDLRIICDHGPLGPARYVGTKLSGLSARITGVEDSFIILNIRINYSHQLSSLSHNRYNNNVNLDNFSCKF